MQSYATALCAAALLAAQAGAASTLAAQTPALAGEAVGGTGDGAPACLLTSPSSCAPTLAPTSNDVADVLGMSIDTWSVALDTKAANHLDGTATSGANFNPAAGRQMGVLRMKVKWRGASAVRELGTGLTGTPTAAVQGPWQDTTLSAAGATWWAKKWAAVKSQKASGSGALHLSGVSLEGCEANTAGWAGGAGTGTGTTGCAGAARRKLVGSVLSAAGGLQALGATYTPTPADGTYQTLVGPVVRLVPAGAAYITKLTAAVVTDLCATAKLVVTAWSGTVVNQGVVAGSNAAAELVVSSATVGTATNTHAARPWHNLDVPGWTACVLNYRCPAAGAAHAFTSTASTAADCAGTTGVTARFPRKRATLAAGKSVKVEAYVDGSAWGGSGATAAQQKPVTATGTVLVKLYANCAEITAVTATPASKTLTAAAGKTVTTPVTFAHNMAATWTQAGMCGEAVSASAGTNKAWVTWAAGVATVKVPANAPTAKTTVTITAAFPSQGGGTATGLATGKGTFTLTLDVTAAVSASAGGSKTGAADVAGTAASVVAGVLGGALFAAAFAPAPPAATAGAGASAAAGGANNGAQE